MMSELLTISLVDIRFWAFHGVFPEEKILGNWFTVRLEVSINSLQEISTLDQTIDYGSLFAILKEKMSEPTELLEDLAEKIKNRILETYQQVQVFKLEIQKQRPAIGLLDGNSQISLSWENK